MRLILVNAGGVSSNGTIVARAGSDANTSANDDEDNSYHSAEESDSSEDEVWRLD